MAHPYDEHNEHHKSHKRVGHILRHEPSGAQKHGDGAAYSTAKTKVQVVKHDGAHTPGKKGPARYARGGKVGHKGGKGHQTNIAIVVPHHTPPTPGGGPQGGASPSPLAPPPPMAGPPGGLPPGLPPPGAMPGGPPPGGGPGGPMPPMMRAGGGRVPGGIATAHNLKGWAARARAHSFASGGKVTAGAATGVGRLQKAHAEKRK